MEQKTNLRASHRYLLIGSGRLATHLKHYFELINEPNNNLSIEQNKISKTDLDFQFYFWDRSQDPHLLGPLIEKSTHVLLAISDSAIEGFFRKHLLGHNKTVVHFSGALHFEGLICTHPLMSFSHDLFELNVYEKIYFTMTGAKTIQDIFPFFKNPSTEIQPAQKPLYHALCVVSGNFPVILWKESLQKMQELGFDESIFDLYLEQVLKNFKSLRGAALTGPLARKDMTTIEKNINSLAGTSLQQIYQTMTKEYL